MRRDRIQQVLQTVYDHFYATGGTWPSLGHLQRMLNRQYNRRIDAVQVLQHISPTLLKPLSTGFPVPGEKLVLTLQGIARCSGSGDDVENSLTAVRWLARRAEHSDLVDEQDERGVRFTVSQLAEAVSLSLDSDQEAIGRLIAILKSEGWT